MEQIISLSKESSHESLKNYQNYKSIFQKIFSIIKNNSKYSNIILKYLNFEKDEKYFHLLFILFSQYQKWINPYEINIGKYSKHFKYTKKESDDKIEQEIIKCINSKNLMKLFVYWHFYILNIFSEISDEKNDNKNIFDNGINLIDIENILYQNNNKIINLYKSKSITISDLFAFLYIYLFWFEYIFNLISHEKNLKVINNILFSLLFNLLEKIGKEIFSDNYRIDSAELKNNINLYFSFLEEIKMNEFINNDYNIIILLDSNIIQNFMINLLKNINPKILENIFPSYLLKLTDFFSNFFNFRFNKSKLMDFILNNLKRGLINIKYFETEKDNILNDVFIHNFQSDLIKKIFSYENKKLNQPNFNSFLFNGKNSKISLNIPKMSLDNNLIIFSFFIKSDINNKNSFSERQPLFSFSNNKGCIIFQTFLKIKEQNEIEEVNTKMKINKNYQYSLIIKFNNRDEKIIKELNFLEPNITYLICFHLNSSFVNIKLYPINSINTKILSSYINIKNNFEEQNLILNIGFDNHKEKNYFLSGYIGYFHIFKLFNTNNIKIDYENNNIIIERILFLKDYYKYIIFYLKEPEVDYKSEISLDYVNFFKNKIEIEKADKILQYIKNERKNHYNCILFLSPELFKLSNIKEDENIENFIIPTIPNVCEQQKYFIINKLNITFVRFENSKEIFLMKNGLNFFCLQFEYFFQFANYYDLFLKKTILGELSFDKDTCMKLIKSTINNILFILSKFIIDLKITNFFAELKQIFSILFAAIKILSSKDSIIDSIFQQLSSIFIIICEQIVFMQNMNLGIEKKLYEENNDIKFFVSLRDSILDILLTKDLHKNPEFLESFFDKIIYTIESNNSKDICSTNPNIFKKVLNFADLIFDYLEKFQPDWKNKLKEKEGSIPVLNNFIKLIKKFFKRKNTKIKYNTPFNLLLSYCLKDISIDDIKIYIFFPLISDGINEGFSLNENDINNLIKYFNIAINSEANENFHENEKAKLSKHIVSILIKSIFEKNNKKNLNYFCNEIKQLDLSDDLLKLIIVEILNIFSNNMDINNMSVIFYTNLDKNNNKIQNKTIGNNDISIENFDFNNFFDDLFEFIQILIKKSFSKRDNFTNLNQDDIYDNHIISKISKNISPNKNDIITQEIINLLFFIEEMITAHINHNNIQLTTLLCLLDLIELIHIIVVDEVLIEFFYEERFIFIFKSIIELCIKSKIIYTNYYLNFYEKSSTLFKTIPETILDILIKLIKSEKIKNKKNEKNKQKNNFFQKYLISILNEIFLINFENISEKNNQDKRSLFYYNDLYRFFFSKNINNIDNKLKEINKNKIIMKNSNKFGNDFE